jgi:hypothetical protein
MDQTRAFSVARVKVVDRLGEMQSLRSFQRLQAPSMMREFRLFRSSPLIDRLDLSHHSSKEGSSSCGESEARTMLSKMLSQNCLGKHIQVKGVGHSPPPDHRVSIGLDEEAHGGPICPLSNSGRERPAT